MTRRGLPSIWTTVPGGATIVRFALPEVDLGDGFRFADLRDLSDLAPDLPLVAGLTGPATDFFLTDWAGFFFFVWADLSRPAGICAKECGEEMRIEKMKKKSGNLRSLTLDPRSSILNPRSSIFFRP